MLERRSILLLYNYELIAIIMYYYLCIIPMMLIKILDFIKYFAGKHSDFVILERNLYGQVSR